jgi:sucrose-6-phosphate hydrolase SacC (GH32 family)
MNWPGGNFFAPETLLDPQGRRICWAWVTDPREMRTQRATGSGYQSLPRVLALADDGTLRITPVPELEALRSEPRATAPAQIPAAGELPLPAASGDSFELQITLDPAGAAEVGLLLRCTPDGAEQTAILYDVAARQLIIDVSRSTTRTDLTYSAGPLDAYGGARNTQATVAAPLDLPPGEPLRLRVFLDRSLLEVFANDRQCLTQQIYPGRADAVHVRAFARGGQARLVSGQRWTLQPARFVNEKFAAAPP